MSESFNKFKPVTIKALRGNSESYAFDLKNSAGSAYVISGTVTLTVNEIKMIQQHYSLPVLQMGRMVIFGHRGDW
jgi:hypothetical protein